MGGKRNGMTDRQNISDISDAERETRIDLAAAFRLVKMYGRSDFLATHSSARAPDTEDQFLINPFGMLFEEMTATGLSTSTSRLVDLGLTPRPCTLRSAVKST